MSLYIDISELLAVPMRTGIQRISGELCRYFPPLTVTPVRLDGDRYVTLPLELISAIGGYFRDGSESAVAAIGRLTSRNGPPVEISLSDTVIVPEIFSEPRAAFFRAMPEQQLQRCRFIVYDLLPFTHPEYFPAFMPSMMAGYYQIIRKASCCGFISEYTRDAYYTRLKRTHERGGAVLPLGSDSLGPRPKRTILGRPLTFSVIGTIEPRKNHKLILDAFEPLLQQVRGLNLAFVGKMGWVDPAFSERVHRLAAHRNSGFRFYPSPDDGAIRTCVENSRATIYVSAAEGYGLPPVESLWLGTPVIASTTTPSLQQLGSAGVHYVEPVTVPNLRRAVFAFLNDAYANGKIEEAMYLRLPTWQSFTDEVLQWCA